jgi:hypothetical protein
MLSLDSFNIRIISVENYVVWIYGEHMISWWILIRIPSLMKSFLVYVFMKSTFTFCIPCLLFNNLELLIQILRREIFRSLFNKFQLLT